jgi:hypothetical protein
MLTYFIQVLCQDLKVELGRFVHFEKYKKIMAELKRATVHIKQYLDSNQQIAEEIKIVGVGFRTWSVMIPPFSMDRRVIRNVVTRKKYIKLF